jgi:zeta-carotene desaturase
MSRPDVVVIGAGFAGLSAAVRLVDRGARVLVVEQRRRLGGRATAFADPATGEPVDNGQHALFGCYHETFEFLWAIGAGDRVALDERLDLTVVARDGTRSRLHTPAWPPPLHLVGGLLSWSALGWRDRVAALKMGLALRGVASNGRRGGGHPLTVHEWLLAHGQTPRLCELLWEPLVVAALNQSPHVAEAGPFVEVLSRMFSGSRRDAAIGLPRVPLDALYAVPAREWLESRGSSVRPGVTARVAAMGDRAAGVDLNGERIEAGAVISSVPWHAFPDVARGIAPLDALARNAEAMAASPIVTVNLWYDRAVADGAFVGLPGRRFQWAFDKARIFGSSAGHLSLVSSGADDVVGMGNDELIALAAAEMSDALPAAKAATLRRGLVVRERMATFSLAPGQPTRPGTETPLRGFFLAGDWTDTGLPATIEGAVVSGHRAAEVCLSASIS